MADFTDDIETDDITTDNNDDDLKTEDITTTDDDIYSEEESESENESESESDSSSSSDSGSDSDESGDEKIDKNNIKNIKEEELKIKDIKITNPKSSTNIIEFPLTKFELTSLIATRTSHLSNEDNDSVDPSTPREIDNEIVSIIEIFNGVCDKKDIEIPLKIIRPYPNDTTKKFKVSDLTFQRNHYIKLNDQILKEISRIRNEPYIDQDKKAKIVTYIEDKMKDYVEYMKQNNII